MYDILLYCILYRQSQNYFCVVEPFNNALRYDLSTKRISRIVFVNSNNTQHDIKVNNLKLHAFD